MESLELFEFIQSEEDDSKILEELRQHIKKRKKLPWFQDIIPGLIPGIEDGKTWLDNARKLLWSPAEYSEHKVKLIRMQKLLQPSPTPLSPDRYRLRQHWPIYIEALRPMSDRMFAAANEVYEVVAKQDCLTEDRNIARATSEIDDKHHAFVTIAVALQDKVLSPIISDIKRRQKSLDEEIQRAEDQKPGGQTMQQQLDFLSEEKHENQELLKALVRFRDTLVDEKDTTDQHKDLKRNSVDEYSDSDEVMSRKSAKRRLPLR
ncbi:hypothetical protein COCMIDRAFT_102398 [Bipolaris oryzae ATCC 44560]|uniref:Uncharacterized protein n=1 Tax=Bipolaris oryzae ATCC 44560 TaxID=930090 RepID=W6Z5N1_COCMI|nr:uncharacterized protein COCMIDRAFT_102398 [Bipolaris oryzae ATCC 44560]EUC42864.1 hypothetical protein COCMIDRAFT_102398 [Bipolaris oryzae ATCC 44560]